MKKFAGIFLFFVMFTSGCLEDINRGHYTTVTFEDDEPAQDTPPDTAPETAVDCGTGLEYVHLRRTVSDTTGYFKTESGVMFYSASFTKNRQVGYLYAKGYEENLPEFAAVVSPGECFSDYDGYQGLALLEQVEDAAAYQYGGNVIAFGTMQDECYAGLLLFRQNGRHGVMEFVEIDEDGNLTFEYWLAADGVTDLRAHAHCFPEIVD